MSDATKPIDDGGPAFPRVVCEDGVPPDVREGMTLRDWFAGQALTRSDLNSRIVERVIGENIQKFIVREQQEKAAAMARHAYAIADAMLAARKAGEA